MPAGARHGWRPILLGSAGADCFAQRLHRTRQVQAFGLFHQHGKALQHVRRRLQPSGFGQIVFTHGQMISVERRFHGIVNLDLLLYADKSARLARGESPCPGPEMEDRAAPQRDAAARSSGPRSLGIIAGGGPMPAKVATAARAAGRQVFIVGVEGFADRAVLAPWPHEILRIGAAGRIVAAFRENGCQDLVMIGPVRRPSLLDLRPDADGVRILARIGRAIFLGDDGLLAAIMRVFAEEGFRVIGAHEIMQGVIAPLGVLSRLVPDASALADIARGVEVDASARAADVGQGCVISAGPCARG